MKKDHRIEHARKRFMDLWDRPLIASVILCVILIIGFLTIFAVSDGDPRPDDRYFHLKYAYLLRTEGWDRAVENFDWIYLLNDNDGVHRYSVSLFQILLIPFTFIDDQLFALNVVDAVIASVMIALFYYIMRKERVRFPLFFALVLIGTSFFITRALMGRAYVLVPSLVLLEIYFAIHKKRMPLLATAIFHVLWHQATYFLPLLVIGVAECARYIASKKWDHKNLLYGAAGVVGGMMFLPGFPYSLFAWMKNLFFVHDVAGENFGGASEITSKSFFADIASKELLLAVLLLSLLSTLFFYKKWKNDDQKKGGNYSAYAQWLYSMAIFSIVIVSGSLLISGRFFDFIVPVTTLFFAIVVTLALSLGALRIDEAYMKKIGLALWIWLAVMCVTSIRTVHTNANYFEYRPIEQAATWIEKNSQEGDKVFLHNWSYFTLFFFENHHNTYSMGIEPASLKSYDEELYWKYYNMFAYTYYCGLERDCEDRVKEYYATINQVDVKTRQYMDKRNSEAIIRSLKNDFDAQFIVSDSTEFTRVIALSPEYIANRYDVTPSNFAGNALPITVFKLK